MGVSKGIHAFPLYFKGDTVDGRNPAPADMVNIPLFTWFYTSQVVQDFVHQQYFCWILPVFEGLRFDFLLEEIEASTTYLTLSCMDS